MSFVNVRINFEKEIDREFSKIHNKQTSVLVTCEESKKYNIQTIVS